MWETVRQVRHFTYNYFSDNKYIRYTPGYVCWRCLNLFFPFPCWENQEIQVIDNEFNGSQEDREHPGKKSSFTSHVMTLSSSSPHRTKEFFFLESKYWFFLIINGSKSGIETITLFWYLWGSERVLKRTIFTREKFFLRVESASSDNNVHRPKIITIHIKLQSEILT